MKRVLLVEDDDAVAELVELILDESGYLVDRVSSVEDALVSVYGEPPAAVLLDLSLPGASGISFLRTCRASSTLASLPIVVVTGAKAPMLEGDLSPDAVLPKPFDIDQLGSVVDRLTGERSGTSSIERMFATELP
jgi:two-component system phosphate regulon response regulator PhoB